MDQNNLRVSGLRDSPKLHRDLAIKKKKKKKKSSRSDYSSNIRHMER